MTTDTAWEHVDRDSCVTTLLPFDVMTPRTARHQMSADLRAAGIRETVVEDAEVVLAELAANAIEHGRPDPEGRIEISWCLHAERSHLLISVLDFGDIAVDLDKLEMTDDALRGRGLAMVDHICARWTVETGDGVRVTAQLDFSGAPYA